MICKRIQRTPNTDAKRRCVFLDRDGTLTEYCGFVTRPEQLRLVPGAGAALCDLLAAGWACVIVSNQSAVGRGLITESELDDLHTELLRQLSAEGASVDAIYWCPDRPYVDDERAVESLDRKPGPGMLLAAAADLNLDLRSSWMVGDRLSDVLAGINAGCRSIRVTSGFDYGGNLPTVSTEYVTVSAFGDAAAVILSTSADCEKQRK